MKTSELTGAALDWAVAKAEGNVQLQYDSREGLIIRNILGWIPYRPSVAWQQGGPIIERERIGLGHAISEGNSYWFAIGYLVEECGPTPLVAAMRCYVASKLSDEVEVPEELQ
jgi:hypothetical protein